MGGEIKKALPIFRKHSVVQYNNFRPTSKLDTYGTADFWWSARRVRVFLLPCSTLTSQSLTPHGHSSHQSSCLLDRCAQATVQMFKKS